MWQRDDSISRLNIFGYIFIKSRTNSTMFRWRQHYRIYENQPWSDSRKKFVSNKTIKLCPNPVLSSFMSYHRVCNKSNTMGVTRGAGTAYLSGVPEFTPGFSGLRVTRSLLFCVMFCGSLFVFLSFLFWPLCCLSFFDLRILITSTPLVYL